MMMMMIMVMIIIIIIISQTLSGRCYMFILKVGNLFQIAHAAKQHPPQSSVTPIS